MKITTLFLSVMLGMAVQAQTTHELLVMDFEFSPAMINAVQGDSLRIIPVDAGHTFTQVSQATWEADGNTPSGQYQYDPLLGEITIELAGSGTIYYVCAPHASMGMKGIVDVELTSSIADHSLVRTSAFYPNPASDVIWMRDPTMENVEVRIVDALGREAARMQMLGTAPFNVGDLPTGLYVLRMIDNAGVEIHRQQLMVAR